MQELETLSSLGGGRRKEGTIVQNERMGEEKEKGIA